MHRKLLIEARQAILNILAGDAKITGCANRKRPGCGHCTCCQIKQFLADHKANPESAELEARIREAYIDGFDTGAGAGERGEIADGADEWRCFGKAKHIPS